jgi:LysM repeat protein
VGIKDSIQIARQGIIENLVNKKDIKAHAQVEKSLKKTQDFHVVKAGESLSLIVMQYHLTTEALFALNPGLASKQHKIYSGMKIRIAR